MAARLTVRDADRARDGHDLLTFQCWNGDPEVEYVAEVEDYVRRFSLRTAYKTLVFRDPSNALAAVSAFDREAVSLSGRRRSGVWRLQVIALGIGWQGTWVETEIPGCSSPMRASEFVLRKTYERMLALDPKRVLVVARIHHANFASMRACERVGLLRTEREDLDYWRALGEVDPAAQPPS